MVGVRSQCIIGPMQTTLDHLPEEKQVELERITALIRKAADVDMIVLFGSFARGDWVEDRYVEENILYEYHSDYDILVLVASEKKEKNYRLWQQIRSQIARDHSIRTPVSLLIDTVEFVNQQLADGRYFYADIQREGRVLFTNGKYELREPRELSEAERSTLAEEDRRSWLSKAEQHLERFAFSCGKNMRNLAAFDLHQAAESLLICTLLVRTWYRPKTHDLEVLLRDVSRIDLRFQSVFPRESEDEERLFSLLRRAYVDARYDKRYAITDKELRELKTHVDTLMTLVKEVCDPAVQ